MTYYSQEWTAQDRFVAETLEFKKNGTFLDIGCHHYKDISNTYYLENELNWSGVGVDIECHFEQEWIANRPNSKFVCADAVNIDYDVLLKENKMPLVIDYLSVDIEPPLLTFAALKKLFETDYIFGVVTFETDFYREKSTRDESRELFKQRGYIFIKEINSQDDYYIHSSYIK
jgi:hypothetical protein